MPVGISRQHGRCIGLYDVPSVRRRNKAVAATDRQTRRVSKQTRRWPLAPFLPMRWGRDVKRQSYSASTSSASAAGVARIGPSRGYADGGGRSLSGWLSCAACLKICAAPTFFPNTADTNSFRKQSEALATGRCRCQCGTSGRHLVVNLSETIGIVLGEQRSDFGLARRRHEPIDCLREPSCATQLVRADRREVSALQYSVLRKHIRPVWCVSKCLNAFSSSLSEPLSVQALMSSPRLSCTAVEKAITG